MARKTDDRRLALYFDVLVLRCRGKTTAYKVEELPGTGPRCWQLHRHDPPPDELDSYCVWLPPGRARCNWPAGRRGKQCKHKTAVLKLLDLGRL